jgi:nitric oxide reductase subunit B
MVILNLFPAGVLQLLDVLKNGYWHARSPEFLNKKITVAIEWLRLPADSIFILLGVVPLLISTGLAYRFVRKGRKARDSIAIGEKGRGF